MLSRRSFVGGASAAAFGLAGRLDALAAERGLDMALVNVNAWTGRVGAPRADAIGIVGDRIVALGADAVRQRIARLTRLIDLQGAFAMPTFTDGHTHFLRGAPAIMPTSPSSTPIRPRSIRSRSRTSRRCTPSWAASSGLRRWFSAR